MTDFCGAAGWGNPHEAIKKLENSDHGYWSNYKGFYSSWLDGYFQEAWAMLMPLDDHGFHRGDGVFEAARIQDGAYIDLDAHLQRLQRSATAIGMELPKSIEEIKEICVNLGRLCQSSNGILRLYVTRGPGGFSPSPKEVIGHQIYVAVTEMKPPPAVQYEEGCNTMFSTVTAKEPFYSRIKSCNYLQNVLMKKECIEKGFDMTICIDSSDHVCEGATENMCVVTHDKRLLVPRFDYTLAGTTVQVAMRLAQELVQSGQLTAVEFADLSKSDVLGAKEAAFVGTTLGVLPIGRIDGHPIADGKAGEVCKVLHQRMMDEFSKNPSLRTQFM
jgi:branched-chain amino acid aminotransferase